MKKLFLSFLLSLQAMASSSITLIPAQPFDYAINIDRRDGPLKVKQKAFEYMYSLEGWCSFQKAALLIDIILSCNPEKIVEIGVYGGKSLVPMAQALKTLGRGKIYGIDPWSSEDALKGVNDTSSRENWAAMDYAGILQRLENAIERFDLKKQIVLIKQTSEAAEPIENIDILHIDGNHSSDASYLDVTKWGPLVKKGGWIILDDITWFENGSFTQAKSIEWLDTHCLRLAEINDAGNDWGIWVVL